MNTKLTGAALSLIAFATTLETARADCGESRIVVADGVTHVDVSWSVAVDGACEGVLESFFWSPTVGVDIIGVAISERPSHGVAGVYSNFRFAYKPAPGYVGKDHFEAIIRYVRGAERKARMDVNVDVVGQK